MKIAPKPTVYRGIRFRSRLEARWAVFFTEIGFDWLYEPTPTINGYQPDFELRGDGTPAAVEVKPMEWWDRSIPADDADLLRWKAHAFAAGQTLVAVFGPPGDWQNGRLADTSFKHALAVSPDGELHQAELAECHGCHRVQFVFSEHRIRCECQSSTLVRAAEQVRDHNYESDVSWLVEHQGTIVKVPNPDLRAEPFRTQSRIKSADYLIRGLRNAFEKAQVAGDYSRIAALEVELLALARHKAALTRTIRS